MKTIRPLTSLLGSLNNIHRAAILFSIIIILQITILLFLFKEKSYSQSTYTVTISENGFSPKNLNIPLNSKVIFTNKTRGAVWIASDYHPTHDLFPKFDTKGPVETQKSWEFIFEKEGNWPYHDHLKPSNLGKIIVSDTTSSNTNNQVNTDKPAKTAISQEIRQKIKQIGASATWNYFRSTYNTNNFPDSHDVAHFLGSQIYLEDGLIGLKSCDPSFAFGCYHGVVEKFVEEKGIDNIKQVITYCKTLPSQTEITCYHGLGHGILPYYKYNLSTSLAECDNQLTSENTTYCYSGTFMEFANVNAKKIRDHDPLWPCNTVDEKYKSSCYDYQMVYLRVLYGNDNENIALTCEKINNSDLIISCIKGLGHQIAQFSGYDPNQILDSCNMIKSDNKYVCIIAAADESIFQKQPYESVNKSLCIPLPTNFREECEVKIKLQKSLLTIN